MKPNSEELARRIDVMVAFQAGEPIQYRNNGSRIWQNSFGEEGNLSFNWEKCDFRIKPQPREGYVFAAMLHQHPKEFHHRPGEDTCFKVREVLPE